MGRAKKEEIASILIAIILSGCLAYSYLVRFTDYLMYSKLDKVLHLAGLWLLVTLFVILFLVEPIRQLIRTEKGKKAKNILIGSVALSIVILAAVYKLPAFPQSTRLEISRAGGGEKTGEIYIVSIERVYLPSGEVRVLKDNKFEIEGDWTKHTENTSFRLMAGSDGTIRYENLIQGYLRVKIQTGPKQGEVTIRHNGEEQIVNAKTVLSGSFEKEYRLPNKWSNADRPRKVFLAGDILSHIALLSFVLFAAGMVVYQGLILKKLKVRGMGAVSVTILLSIGMIIINRGIEREVRFMDARLEEVVREVIKKPQGEILRHELMSIIELDISGLQVDRLDGIEEMSNLRVLRAERNNITDLSPLKALTKLQTLNLRENSITDIAPLNGLKQLTYLNLHSNTGIKDITPLAELRGLNTLILRNVPIGDQIVVLENLTKLQTINLRNSGVTDTEVIGRLMKQGALQDDAYTGQGATVNLLDNPFDLSERDVFAEIRGYWSNVTYRYPVILPYFDYQVAMPEFSPTSGVFGSEFELELTTEQVGGRIFYTLDGSEPVVTREMKAGEGTKEYSGQITIRDRSGDKNVLANIRTSVLNDYVPTEPVAKGTVVRAMVVNENGKTSPVVTHTYFVGEKFVNGYTFPILSIVSAPEGLFSEETGIFIPGENSIEGLGIYTKEYPFIDMNFAQRGVKWERPAYLQIISREGEEVLRQSISIRTHGNSSRHELQKSIRIIAGGVYGEEEFIQFDFFPELNQRLSEMNVDTFQTLVLRTGGNTERFNTNFRDALLQDLLKETRLDIQGYYPVVVFMDGEYWGVYVLRTRYDENYFQTYYGIAPQDLVILKVESQLIIGDPADVQLFDEMLRFIEESFKDRQRLVSDALTDNAKYQTIASMMDIDNFIDYMITGIFVNNQDWIRNNNYYWRTINGGSDESLYGHDGKWRWMVNDLDEAFHDPLHNRLVETIDQPQRTSFLFRSLLQNETFRLQFLNRFADLLNTLFREEVVLAKIDEFEALFLPEMEEQIQRWGQPGGSVEGWQANVEDMREFARLRPEIQRQQLVDYFDLEGTAELTVKVGAGEGHIQINSIEIREGATGVADAASWTGIYFKGVPIRVTAVPAAGYRFSYWEGLEGGVETDESVEITMRGDLELTAVFTR